MKMGNLLYLTVALFMLVVTHSEAQLQYGGYYRYAVNPQNRQNTQQRYPYNQQQNHNSNANRGNMQPQPSGVTMYPYGPGPVVVDHRNPQGRPPYGPHYASTSDDIGQRINELKDYNLVVNIQLSMYSNPNRWVTGGMQCYDDNNLPPPPPVPRSRRKRQQSGKIGAGSGYNSAGDSPNNCQLSFVTTLNTPRWQNNTWNYGPGPWTVVVDSFLLNMTEMQASTSQTPQLKEQTVTGSDIGTQLMMSVGFSCINDALGPNCDLKCNFTSERPPFTCQSFINGRSAVCMSGSSSAVTKYVSDCTECELGVFSDQNGKLRCRQIADGFIKNLTIEENKGWRIAGIILIVLIVLVILLALCSCLAIYFGFARKNRYAPNTNNDGGFNEPPTTRKPVWSNFAYNRAPNSDTNNPPPPNKPPGGGGQELRPAVVPARTTVQNGHAPQYRPPVGSQQQQRAVYPNQQGNPNPRMNAAQQQQHRHANLVGLPMITKAFMK